MSGIDNPIAISAETSPAPKWLLQQQKQQQQCTSDKDDIDSAGDTTTTASQQRCSRTTTSRNNARTGDATAAAQEDAAPASASWPRSERPTDGAATATSLNMNGYASKKSLAQGMLDLALLAANAAQLKFVLSMGESHQFYTLLIVLIVASLCLQVLQVIICMVLGLVLDINKVEEHRRADICNNISVMIIVVVVALNVVISAFDMKTSSASVRTLQLLGGV